ncbi:hypothetical protein B0T25DRAFT_594492 [Lasiosphaeria hispida]|uniref:Kinesin light chain n=1 Tax=Lasiosphaeria hispida TaxID=260671 RepID=A0AAJ0M7Q5_9PEZI|nr:hypothetical protein B0T25DRAFT_594492 [Lasiosphaeria hispida]
MQARELRKRMLGEEHHDALCIVWPSWLQHVYQGRWKEAEPLERQALVVRKAVLGEEHADTLLSMANLASTMVNLAGTCRNQGRWKEAEELEVQMMEVRKRVLGEEHPDTLTTEELELQVIEARKRVLGERSMANLAFTWRSQGRLNEALDLIRRCVEFQQQILLDHPYMASNFSYIA